MPPKRKPDPPKKTSLQPLAEERAREAMERQEPMSGDRVRLTLKVILARRDAEILAARAISQEKNLSQLVEEILEAEVSRRA
jgi:predicted HicB family RNase H-like nuclease